MSDKSLVCGAQQKGGRQFASFLAFSCTPASVVACFFRLFLKKGIFIKCSPYFFKYCSRICCYDRVILVFWGEF